MRVGVGSRNPVKIAAVEAVFDARETQVDPVVVESVGAESGVAEQPFGERETLAGAENRARRAAAGRDLGVGLEGGVSEVADADGLYLTMWAAVTDGESLGRGSGPRLQLPEPVALRIRDGEELGPVMDDVLGESDVAKKQGAAGALTDGIIDRQEALEHAVAGALALFVTDVYDRE
ncbi:inosine/xanthosine triphosphatase [Haladaptatus halobius]|uniref:inosine/xanthosine triphosphatase n=1 Tax=Haladaptatus halobius TaxID=2884875 RepID=UPI001D09DF27|nr:inosine/xanthosine triphosphatase [Haladaptatus halobius]